MARGILTKFAFLRAQPLTKRHLRIVATVVCLLLAALFARIAWQRSSEEHIRSTGKEALGVIHSVSPNASAFQYDRQYYVARFSFRDATGTEHNSEATLWADLPPRLQPGETLAIRYDPDHPSRTATLSPTFAGSSLHAWMGVLLVVTLWLWALFLSKGKENRASLVGLSPKP